MRIEWHEDVMNGASTYGIAEARLAKIIRGIEVLGEEMVGLIGVSLKKKKRKNVESLLSNE